MPDYDGLPDPGPTPEEVLIWVPRVVLAPLHFVAEMLIRRPLGALTTWLERENVPIVLANLFTWEERRAGVVPVAFYDFGLLPSVGLYLFWNDLAAPGHQLRVHVGFGGVDWLRATIRNRVQISRATELSIRVDGWRRPDRIYQGIGLQDRAEVRARYRQDHVLGEIEISTRLWRRSRITTAVSVGAYDFDASGYEPDRADPSLAAAIESGAIQALPPAFGGFVAYRQRILATLDTREDAPRSGSGVRVDAHVEQGVDLLAPREWRWLRWGATLSGYVDAGAERIVSLHVRAAFSDPIGDGASVPFTELAQLGNDVLALPGFLGGSLRDRSALVATLRYRWPVWVWLDATIFVGVGNTFGEHLRDFEGRELRTSWGFGLQSIGDRDASFRLTLALGTRTFGEGAGVESFRLGIGGDLGF